MDDTTFTKIIDMIATNPDPTDIAKTLGVSVSEVEQVRRHVRDELAREQGISKQQATRLMRASTVISRHSASE